MPNTTRRWYSEVIGRVLLTAGALVMCALGVRLATRTRDIYAHEQHPILKRVLIPVGLYRPARWLRCHLRERDALATERRNRAFYADFIRPGDLVFDVGANYGEMTRAFLALGARVIAVEPQTDCVQELLARVGRRRQLIVVSAAVGAPAGTVPFYVRRQRGVSGLVKDWAEEAEAEILVPMVTTDELIARHGQPRYIKIDVEGSELAVLHGLTRQVPYLSIEVALTTAENIAKALRCIEWLAQHWDLQLNLTPAERLSFEGRPWMSTGRFLERFPGDFLGTY